MAFAIPTAPYPEHTSSAASDRLTGTQIRNAIIGALVHVGEDGQELSGSELLVLEAYARRLLTIKQGDTLLKGGET